MNTKVTGCLLVSLRLEAWANATEDNEASLELAKAKKAENRTARVWKTLLPNSSVVKRVNAAIRAIRTYHYRNTLTYLHDGPRILTAANYLPYKDGLRSLQDELANAVEDLVVQLEQLKTLSKKKLGDLFKDDDYPTENNLRAAYGLEVIYAPMPDGANLLSVGLESQEASELRAQLEAGMQDTFERANRKLWEDMYSRLATLLHQLSADKAIPHDKTVEGLKSLVELLPRLNLTNDDRLAQMTERLRDSLAGVTAGGLRTDPMARERVAAEAKTIHTVMSAFMAGRKGTELKRAA